jgi:hypothetical protein
MFARTRASDPHRLPDHAPTGSASVPAPGPRRDRGVRPHLVDPRGAATPRRGVVPSAGGDATAEDGAADPGDGPPVETPRGEDEPSVSAALRALLDAVRDDVEGLQSRWRDGVVPETAEVDAIAARLATAHEIVLARRRSARNG